MKRILWLFIFVAFCVTGLTKWGFGASSILSNYGQIQNVQNYSSNPFWSPNSPYNKKLPQPVYLQGADLTAGDCQQVVQSLISVQCMTRNNCKNTSLSDIRPAIMVQLSSLSDQHNYASSCAGFIDTIFESYMAQYGNNIPKKTAFPTVSVPSPTTNPNAIELHNPYKIETPEWKQDIIERSQELQNLQQQNGAGNYKLSATAFPKTIDDVSFAEQMENLQEGYAPFKDKSAFHQINVKSLYEYCKSHSDAPECKQYREQQQAQNGNSNGNNGATTPTGDKTAPAKRTSIGSVVFEI
ncbi:MAG: hypothetical protein MJ158_03450 [Alphaproteobacteria bacterium]|nr:hypothetical protein [Alphaproteobacteria bacterium]